MALTVAGSRVGGKPQVPNVAVFPPSHPAELSRDVLVMNDDAPPSASKPRVVAVIGLGYVGLPVAIAAARARLDVIGFDIDAHRIAELQRGHDRTKEVDSGELVDTTARFTTRVPDLKAANFYIVTVPTPIDGARRPDLSALIAASHSVGSSLGPGDIVVFESTVYPGVTEDVCLPVLEGASGLRGGTDFTVGYSPERINPGDRMHRVETIMKVVSGQDARTLDSVAEVYGQFVKAGIHKAPSIKVAEAAKVIENAQRDINIAFMNELSAIFHLIGIDTGAVLAAARTKWNFLPFTPGLVGGHCIGVDPYYLTHKAEILGYHPQVILAGRRINDGVGQGIARECVKLLLQHGGGRRVTVLGLTFKENVPDIRNSRAFDIIAELQAHELEVQASDPLADPTEVAREYGIEITPFEQLKPADAVALAVPHAGYESGGWDMVTKCLASGARIVLDIKSLLDPTLKPPGLTLWCL